MQHLKKMDSLYTLHNRLSGMQPVFSSLLHKNESAPNHPNPDLNPEVVT